MYRNLEAELRRKGITHKELATKMKIHVSTLSKKLKGKSPLRFDEAIKIVQEIFNNEFEIKYLFEDCDKIEEPV